jgi:hypothetical protein
MAIFLNTSKEPSEARLNIIYKFSPYLKEDITRHHDNDKLVNVV